MSLALAQHGEHHPTSLASWRKPSLPELRLLDNLRMHKLRSVLTMLGMIFGVASVVAMLSIGAGARKEVMAFIEQLGVHNLIVEAREAVDQQSLNKVRRISPGLTFQDLRVIRADTAGLAAATARKTWIPSTMIPKPEREMPTVYGVGPVYREIAGLRVVSGRFFDGEEDARAAPVCVLGEGARMSLFGPRNAVGEYVKAGEQWFHVIGVAGPLLTAQPGSSNLLSQDPNNIIYVPLRAAIFRLADSQSGLKDEIDGVYLQLIPGADSVGAAGVVRSILDSSHAHARDFSLIVPAELLAEQKRTEEVFNIVMVAIASISLLIGGIGIMNIMLASILELTHEIGLRRAVGARKSNIFRQFLFEAMLISFAGGVAGLLLGFGISRLIAALAGWSTIVTPVSVAVAFLVSVAVGLTFGIYPAIKASRLDPIEALRYE